MPTLLTAAGVDTKAYDLDGLDLADLAVSEDRDRTVYSQYQRDALGVYMATNRRWKYFYSVPDRREFLFDRIHDPEEMRSRAGLSLCRDDLKEIRTNLFEFYRREGFTDPIEEEDWKLFPQPLLSPDPDVRLLIQDPGWSKPYQVIPGYTD